MKEGDAMAVEFVTAEELDQVIEEEEEFHEGQIEVLKAMREALNEGGTLFRDKEADEWFYVPKGQPIPKHMEATILRK